MGWGCAIIWGVRAPGRLRYAGLGATALLAAGAYLAGALPGGDPAPGFANHWLSGTSAAYQVGLLLWACGLALFGVVWWRLRGWLAEVGPRWLLLTGAIWALPLLVAPPLASRDVYAYACQGALWADGKDPYATGVAAGCPWLDAVPALWHDTRTPYGPLALALSGGAAAIARVLPLSGTGQLLAAVTVLRLLAVAGVALAAGCALRLARRHCPDAAPGAAWLAALSPVVMVHAVSGAHNDALLAGLVVAALFAALPDVRSPSHAAGAANGQPAGRAVVVGALLGLAVAVKVTAIVAAPFAVLLLARSPKSVARAAGGLMAGVVGAFAVCTLATGLGFGWVGALRGTGSLVQWTSVPTAVGMALGYPLRALGWSGGYDVAVTVARVAGVIALAVAYVLLLRRCWRADEPGRARVVLLSCGVAFGLVALLSPVFYPWYALAPLAVLAAASLDATARGWVAGAAIGLSALILPQGLGIAVLTKLPGAYLVTLAIVVLSLRAVRAAPRSTG